jgi:SulP family sulfate permease
MIAMVGGILLSWIFDVAERGVRTIGDIGSVPLGLPPLTTPDFGAMPGMLSIAVAAMVLSFVESSSVARAIATRTGQRLDMSAEFAGQGLANIAGGLTGAFVTSGSLLRSAINESSGARSRLAGAMSGASMLAVLLVLGPIIDYTPIACLAGLLIVVAAELIDWTRIRSTFRSTKSDAAAFLVTLGGTWTLPLDHAIELGVVISIILFLRRARLLVIGELVLDEDGVLREVDVHADSSLRCRVVRILNVEGPLFFGAAGELQSAFDATIADEELKVLVVRLKRTQSMDSTTAAVIASVAAKLAAEGRHLVLAGLRPEHVALLERTGVARLLGDDHLFPTRKTWFAAMHDALAQAVAYAEQHDGAEVERLRRCLRRAPRGAVGRTSAASHGESSEEIES